MIIATLPTKYLLLFRFVESCTTPYSKYIHPFYDKYHPTTALQTSAHVLSNPEKEKPKSNNLSAPVDEYCLFFGNKRQHTKNMKTRRRKKEMQEETEAKIENSPLIGTGCPLNFMAYSIDSTGTQAQKRFVSPYARYYQYATAGSWRKERTHHRQRALHWARTSSSPGMVRGKLLSFDCTPDPIYH